MLWDAISQGFSTYKLWGTIWVKKPYDVVIQLFTSLISYLNSNIIYSTSYIISRYNIGSRIHYIGIWIWYETGKSCVTALWLFMGHHWSQKAIRCSHPTFYESYIISEFRYNIFDFLYHIWLPISYLTSYIISDFQYHIWIPIYPNSNIISDF